MPSKRKAVFLDRDGVINRGITRQGRPYPPDSLEELELLPGVEQALSGLKNCGMLLIVVTNQPDVAKGKQRREVVEDMHRALQGRLPLDEIKVCYHLDQDNCACRKPKPGMLRQAARDWDIDLAGSYMVGDRWRDVEAGQAAGCHTFFIDYGYEERRPCGDFETVSSLLEASARIISRLSAKP